VLYITFGADYKPAPAGVLLLSSIVHSFTYLGDITAIFFSSQPQIRITYPNVYWNHRHFEYRWLFFLYIFLTKRNFV